MGVVTKSIGSAGGRDFSSLSAWAASLPANLVTDGNSYVGQCYNDSEFTTTGTILTLSGHTTDATHTITLTTGPGQSFRDNAGVQTNALAYNVSNGVGIRRTSGSYSLMISISDANVLVSNLQIKTNIAGGTNVISAGIASNVVQNCILDGGTTRNTNADRLAAAWKVINCLIVDRSTTGSSPISLFLTGTAPIIANNTFVRLGAGTPTCVVNSYNSPGVKNCAFFGGFSKNFSVANGTLTYANCATDNAAWGTGTLTDGGGNLISKTFANQFQSTTTDFRLKSGADCVDAGATDTTDIPSADDIAGTARPQGAAWDIGCWELATSGTTLTITHAAMTLAANAATAGVAMTIGRPALALAAANTNAALAITPGKATLALAARSTTAATAISIAHAALTLAGNAVTYSAASAVTVLMGALTLAGKSVSINAKRVLYPMMVKVGRLLNRW